MGSLPNCCARLSITTAATGKPASPAAHRGLPSPYLTVIFTLDEPLVIAEHPDPRQPASVHTTLAGGLHTSPALIVHQGSQSGIQLSLSPLGARALLGVPASELAIIDVEGSDVIGELAKEIQERIAAAVSWPARFAVLDEVLSGLLHSGERKVRPEVSYVWRRLVADGGAVPISELAADTGWSDRHLRAAFRAEIGLTPKAAARVIRFHRAARTLQRRATAGRDLGIADIAASCGYYDQAHLDLDFRAMAGTSPTSWVAQEFRNFQAFAGQVGEGWSHDR